MPALGRRIKHHAFSPVGCRMYAKAEANLSPAPADNPATPTVQRLKPGPDDIVIHNCILTREGKATVDCLCRHATTKIDSVTGDHSLECRVKKTK